MLSGCYNTSGKLSFVESNSFATARICAKVSENYKKHGPLSFNSLIKLLDKQSTPLPNNYTGDYLLSMDNNKPVVRIKASSQMSKLIFVSIINRFSDKLINCVGLTSSYSSIENNIFNINALPISGYIFSKKLQILDQYIEADIYLTEESNIVSQKDGISINLSINENYGFTIQYGEFLLKSPDYYSNITNPVETVSIDIVQTLLDIL